MSDRPSENLHEVFERVAGLVPEMRPKKAPESVGGLYWDAETSDWKYPHGSAPGSAVAILMLTFKDEAEDRIIAACVRWLLANGVQPLCFERNNSDHAPDQHPAYTPGTYLVEEHSVGGCVQQHFGPTPAIALLLAVEAAAKDNK